jgi:hypothetical protein
VESANMEEFLKLAVGPAGSVVVLLLVLTAVWKLATSYLFPLLREYITNQQQNFRDILEDHKEDRKVFTSAIESLMERQDKVEIDLTDIKTDIKQIKDRL